jgi:hypothetical protein
MMSASWARTTCQRDKKWEDEAMKRTQQIEPEKQPKLFSRIEDVPGLKGLGGQQTSHIRALKGSKFGAASRVRTLSDSERAAVEARLRAEGKL